MSVILAKQWKNHPKGTVLESVSDGVAKDLKKAKLIKTEKKADEKPETRSVKAPSVDKQVKGSKDK